MLLTGWTTSILAVAALAVPSSAGVERNRAERLALIHHHESLNTNLNIAAYAKVIQELVKPQIEFQSADRPDSITSIFTDLITETRNVVVDSGKFFTQNEVRLSAIDCVQFLDSHSKNLQKAAEDLLDVSHPEVAALDAEEQMQLSNLITWSVLDMVQLLEIYKAMSTGLSSITQQVRDFDTSLYTFLDRVDVLSPAIIANVRSTLARGSFYTGTFYSVGIDLSTDILAPAIQQE